MTQPLTSIRELQRGDIVRHQCVGDSYVVEHIDGDTAIGVRTISITNPDEWELVKLDNRFTMDEAIEIGKRAIKTVINKGFNATAALEAGAVIASKGQGGGGGK